MSHNHLRLSTYRSEVMLPVSLAPINKPNRVFRRHPQDRRPFTMPKYRVDYGYFDFLTTSLLHFVEATQRRILPGVARAFQHR